MATVGSSKRHLNITSDSSAAATTMTLGGNGVATEAYVGTQITNLIDSSPAALNTLNELAAALGDDASFSTTVTNSIATKLALAGGTLTGTLTGTYGIFGNHLYVNQSANLTSQALQVNGFIDITDISSTALRWYNGSTFRGGLGTNAWAMSGSDSDLAMYISGDNSFFVQTNNVTRAEFDSSGLAVTGNVAVSGDLTVTGTDIRTGSNGQLSLGDDSSVLSIGRGNEMWTQNSLNAAATLYVNYRGYNGGSTQFRSLDIRDGKAGQIANFNGSDKSVSFAGNVSVTGTIGASNFSGSSSGTNTGDQDLSGYLTEETYTAHEDTSTLSGTYGSTANGTKIDEITVDSNGHITNITTGATGNMTGFFVEDGDGTEVQINNANEWKFVEGTGININWTDTDNGTDADPYDLTFSIKDNSVSATQLNVSGNGTSGQVLASDGDGTFSWASSGGTGTVQTVTGTGTVSGLTLSDDGDDVDPTLTLGGSITTPVSGDWWNGGFPKVGTDGVMEIGKYIDFHETDAGTSDYDYRMYLNSGTMTFSGDALFQGGDVYIVKQNDAPTLTLLHDGTNPSTNDLLFKMQFQSDYDGTHQNWGKIELDTNTSAVRTNMDFYVKSTSGAEQLGFRIEGQPSETPKAYFYNDVDVNGNISADNFSGSSSGTNTGDQTLPTLSSLGALSTSGGTMTGALTITHNPGDGLILQSATDVTTPVGITFTSQGTSATQKGHIRYNHRDSLSYGSAESFTIGGTETTTTILADGKLMYAEGIYSKPSSGTAAGTRKDANWDTAYGWGNHASAGYLTSLPSHNHDDRYYTETEINTKYTTTDGSGDEWKFTLGDESSLSGNKWYKVATINQGSGGLHIKGSFSNHVESFGTQHVDLLLQGREGNSGDEIEITGRVDVLNNATTGTDKVGIRVIEADTSSSPNYHYYDVYMRTTRYTQAEFHLTKFGMSSFHTSKPSVTSEPAPVSGGNVELDTSSLAEGNYVVDDSTPREIYHEGHKPTYTELGTMAYTNLTGTPTIPTNNNQLTNGAGYLTSETFGSSDVVMSLSGNDITAGASITLAGGLSFNASTNTLSQTDSDTVYTHPTSAGNKHIPTGGAAGQFLKYSSSGTAVWATPSYTTNTDTTYSAGGGLDLTSTTFSVEPDLRDGITHVGKDANNYIQFDSTNGRIDFYAGGVFVARMESDGDLHIKGDVIAFSDIFS